MAWQGKRALREGSTAAARVGQGPQPEAQGPPVTTHPCRPGPASPVLAALTAHRGDTPRGRGRWGKAWTALPGLRSAAGGAWPLSTRRTPTRQHTRARRRPCSPEQPPSLQNPGPCLHPRLAPVLAAPLAFSVAFEEEKPRGPLSGGNPAPNRRPEGPAPWTAGLRANEQPTEPPQATQTPGEAERLGPHCLQTVLPEPRAAAVQAAGGPLHPRCPGSRAVHVGGVTKVRLIGPHCGPQHFSCQGRSPLARLHASWVTPYPICFLSPSLWL